MSDYIRITFWSKLKKKNIQKQVSLKKFDNDREKAQQYLNNWKEEELKKESPNIEETKPLLEEKHEVIEESKKEVPKIQITKFELNVPDLDEDACSTVIYGSSKSGKTTQTIKIIKEYFDEKNIIILVFSPNIHSKVYAPLKNKRYIKFDRWDDEVIRGLHKIQKKTGNKYKFLIVIDDCILEKLSPQILQLLLVLRNSLMNTLLNLQSITLLTKNGRNNGNNFIFRYFNNDEIIEEAMDFFLGAYEPFYKLSMDDKKRLYKEAVKDYGYIYLNALDGKITFHRD